MLQQSNNLQVIDVVHANALQVQGVAYSGGSAGSIPAVQLVLQEAQYSFFWKPAVLSDAVIYVVLVSLMSAILTCLSPLRLLRCTNMIKHNEETALPK